MTIIDFSSTYPSPQAVKAAGHEGVMLYLSPPRETWMGGKKLTKAIVDGYKAAGLMIATCWQYGAGNPRDSDVMRGAAGGRADAEAARKKLNEVGLPGHPVYFCVDFDITLEQWNSTAVHYFRAAGEVLGKQRVGGYGHSRCVHWMLEDGVVADLGGGRCLGWVTRSWSHGETGSGYAALYQRTHNVPGPDGVQVDVNDVLHTYWGQHPPSENPQPKETPMADNAVDIDLHHLIPFGRPTPLPKKRIIVHTTENTPGTSSRAILDYQVRTRTGSYHRLVDATGQITLANSDDWQTWSVGNKGNDIALHVSLVAQAKMKRAEWLAQPKMLEGCARVIAYWARTYDIPLVKLSRQELGAGKHGVAGHLEAQVWGATDHWDPGYEFPYDVVLARAKEINEGKSAPAVSVPPTPAPKAPMTLDTPCKSHVAGSKHVAPLADYIMYIDRGVYEGRHQIDQVLAATERIEKQNAEILALLKEQNK